MKIKLSLIFIIAILLVLIYSYQRIKGKNYDVIFNYFNKTPKLERQLDEEAKQQIIENKEYILSDSV